MHQPSPPREDAPRTVECALCGVTSTLPELFQWCKINQERMGSACPRCFAERQASYSKWFLEAVCLVAALAALFWFRGPDFLGFTMGSLAMGCLFTVLLTPLHELAHALVALSLGMRVHAILIGWFGQPLLKFDVGRCSIEVTRIPLGGLTYASDRGTRFIRLKHFLVVAAGPLMHVVLLIVTWVIVDHAEEFGSSSRLVVWLAIVFGFANAFEIVLNLWPKRFQMPFGEVTSDGLALLTLPFVPKREVEQWAVGFYYYEALARLRQGDDTGAIECLHEGLKRYSGDISLESCYGVTLFERGEYDKAARIFEELRQRADLPGEFQALLLNNIASADVAGGKVENLEQALHYSRKAIEALPWEPFVKATRGSVLAASGDSENGMRLLEEAWAEDADIRNQALVAAFLANASAQLGRLDEARDWLRKAERLNPRCIQLERARREIDKGALGASSDE